MARPDLTTIEYEMQHAYQATAAISTPETMVQFQTSSLLHRTDGQSLSFSESSEHLFQVFYCHDQAVAAATVALVQERMSTILSAAFPGAAVRQFAEDIDRFLDLEGRVASSPMALSCCVVSESNVGDLHNLIYKSKVVFVSVKHHTAHALIPPVVLDFRFQPHQRSCKSSLRNESIDVSI